MAGKFWLATCSRYSAFPITSGDHLAQSFSAMDTTGKYASPDGHPNSPTFGHFKIPHPDESVTVQ